MKYLTQASLVAACLIAMVPLSGCSPEGGTQTPAVTTVTEPALSTTDKDAQATTDAPELAGTSWRLVKIMGMDDSVAEPDEPSRYTLEFSKDGQAAILADCNRGTGSWSSEQPGNIQFGPIAATMAMCPEGSISDKYLAQFEWVRSYVMKDGQLFLATMADGSIIEFEPF